MTGHNETEPTGTELAIASMTEYGTLAETNVLDALARRFPQYLWRNLNDSQARAPFDVEGQCPRTGTVVLAVEVKGTDFHGTSPGITIRKAAIARKEVWLETHPDARPVMAC